MSVSAFLIVICVVLAGAALLGVVILAGATDSKISRHPGGRRGFVQDQFLILSPLLSLGVMMSLKAFTTLDDSPFWLGAWGLILVATFAVLWLPVVKRARERLTAANRFPPR